MPYPKRQIILPPIPLHIEIHDHSKPGLDPDQLATGVVYQGPWFGIEMAPRTEEDIAVFAARIPACDAKLGSFDTERFIVEGWMGAKQAEIVPESVP